MKKKRRTVTMMKIQIIIKIRKKIQKLMIKKLKKSKILFGVIALTDTEC